jgi:hypothetical protein
MGVGNTAQGEDVKELHDCNKAISRFDEHELKPWHFEIHNSSGLSYIAEELVFRGSTSPFLI